MAEAGTVADAVARRLLLHPRNQAARRSTCSAATASPMAVATDCNPGTSPLTSLLLAMNMAATLFRMTVDECLAGVTREAARALGHARRDRHAGSRQMVRPRDLGHRAPGRTGLSHGLQSAARRASGGARDRPRPLSPGDVTLADWRAIYRGARRALDPACRPARRSERRRPWRASSPRASRSTASTPASASWRACASRHADLETLQRNIVLVACGRRRRADAASRSCG